MGYQLLDSGYQNKLERVGDYLLVRPSSQAIWRPLLNQNQWKEDAAFSRNPSPQWSSSSIPRSWTITFKELLFKIVLTDFGHIGVFPEQASLWEWMSSRIEKKSSILNLFAYTGGATLMALKQGARVCHVEASKATLSWARENISINHCDPTQVRWILDDVMRFLKREIKRGVKYEGIILDPPTFGRGSRGEVFKIEKDLPEILDLACQLLSSSARFLILSSHTPGYTPLLLHHLLSQSTLLASLKGTLEWGEMVVPGPLDLTAGSYATWSSI